MAEVKNAFIKSKMNKDLDSRLIPQGEYIHAVNVQVSKSEGSDVGSLQNVLGNKEISNFGLSISNLSSIGYLADEASSIIYVFLTDNDGTQGATPDSYIPTGEGSNHFIVACDVANGNVSSLLVTGAFLNFSKLSPVYGVNLIENLLFWTDNRNQPRKINVKSAVQSGYYSSEDNISVAKYNPYQSIELYEASSISPGGYESTMKDVSSISFPDGGTARVDGSEVAQTTINITNTNIPNGGVPLQGHSLSVQTVLGDIVDLNTTVAQGASISSATILYTSDPITVNDGDVLVFNANPYYIPNYKGDPKFLEDKFARFSYRFKFDDGEYSIMAPFTQPCFIPKQDGYFLPNTSIGGDEEQALSSTIVDFMENKVTKIDLNIPLPLELSNLKSGLHIEEIDILYKESDGLAVKVIETIPSKNNFGKDSVESEANSFTYSYESQIPYKTLPADEITRVYDKIPVKALSQEIISNRVVYGNYQDKHTPPSSLDYRVTVGAKSDFDLKTGEADVAVASGAYSAGTDISIANYSGLIAVGSLLSSLYPDDVIPEGTLVTETNGTTSIKLNNDVELSNGITVSFSPPATDSNTVSKVEYPSSSLKTNRNYQVGFVLSDRFGRQSTVILSNNEQTDSTISVSTVFSPYIDEGTDPFDWLGNSLKVTVNSPIATSASGSNPGIYNGDINDPAYNPLGWHSYKIVVKQVEQEYYNVYSAGAMKGLPYNYIASNVTPILGENTSFISLLNDNINKIPRDLSEIGPQDKKFRSSVELFGRVENTSSNNRQFYPGRKSFTTSSIESLSSLFDTQEFKGRSSEIIPITNPLNAFSSFYKSDSDPFIAEISTSQNPNFQFGVNNAYLAAGSTGTANTAAQNVLTAPLNITGTVELGDVLLSIDGDAVEETTVLGVTTDTVPVVTFSKAISYASSDEFIFSRRTFQEINTLTVFETAPVESRLDIFWETSSSGLISDLNNLVLNSTSGGSGFSSWNDEPFSESSSVGDNILSSSFVLLDNLDQPIVFGAGDSFDLDTVFDRQSNPVDRLDWFELYEVSNTSNVYNIRLKQPFVDEAWYGSSVGQNDFDFSFTSVIDGVTTSYNQTANLRNETPVMSGPYDTSSVPSPAVDYDAVYPSSPGDIATFTAINGANTNGHEGKDLSWTVTASKEGVDYSSSFEVQASNTSSLSTGVLRNKTQSGVPSGVYTLEIKVLDAGQAFHKVVISAQLGIVPVKITDYNFRYNRGTFEAPLMNNTSVCVIEVSNTPDPLGLNGFYARHGSWNSISSGVNTINLSQTNGLPYFYSSISNIGARQFWQAHFTNDFPQFYTPDSAETAAAVSNNNLIPIQNNSDPITYLPGLRFGGVGVTTGATVTSTSGGSVVVSANQTIPDNTQVLFGDVPFSEYSNYAFEVI